MITLQIESSVLGEDGTEHDKDTECGMGGSWSMDGGWVSRDVPPPPET